MVRPMMLWIDGQAGCGFAWTDRPKAEDLMVVAVDDRDFVFIFDIAIHPARLRIARCEFGLLRERVGGRDRAGRSVKDGD